MELTRIGSSSQASRYGTYEKTIPLQTTTYGGVTYPVYEKGSDLLHRVSLNRENPWILGTTLGSGAGGAFLADSPQCPNTLSSAREYNGSATVDLLSNEWSVACSGGKSSDRNKGVLCVYFCSCWFREKKTIMQNGIKISQFP